MKLNSVAEIVQSHPKGFEDAVNGSFYKDGGDESERFINDLLKKINELEQRIEAE